MASSSSSPPRPTNPLQASSRRLPPPCWTTEETAALIDAYRLKWYFLNRGNLKASHWQEVADSVTRTCPHVSPPKTSLQCRHKIEKLRKRYRNEKQRCASSAAPPSWPFFRKMDSMEIGAPSPNSDTTDDEDDAGDGRFNGHTRSIHRLLISGGNRPGGRSGGAAGPRIRIVKREVVEEEDGSGFEAGKRRRTRKGEEGVGELVAAIRALGEGFVRMERMKMEMAREAERMKMEMEMKRTEMILESQQRIVDAFVEGFAERNRSEEKPAAVASPPPHEE
ncbi:hypothetical protein AAC387_Pa08g0176 [Persea americana]